MADADWSETQNDTSKMLVGFASGGSNLDISGRLLVLRHRSWSKQHSWKHVTLLADAIEENHLHLENWILALLKMVWLSM